MALLDDVSRLGRVAKLARQGQADSRAAAEAAATARLEVRIPHFISPVSQWFMQTSAHASNCLVWLQGPLPTPQARPMLSCFGITTLQLCVALNYGSFTCSMLLPQAEGDAADARREVATLERENLELAAANRQLARRVKVLERERQSVATTES
jgi:hypothetical protein